MIQAWGGGHTSGSHCVPPNPAEVRSTPSEHPQTLISRTSGASIAIYQLVEQIQPTEAFCFAHSDSVIVVN